ncbi:MAG: hypothetical protein AAGL69_15020 [Pseudomonadota bacterium]
MDENLENTLSVYSSGLVGLIVTAIHFGLSRLAARFQELFSGFGAELPFLTRMLMVDSLYFWVIPVTLCGILVAHQLGWVSRSVAIIANWVGTVGSMIVALFGLYLPIFKMGAVV